MALGLEKMKTKMPDEDWERMQADSNVVEPKRKLKQESEVKNELPNSSGE